MDSLLANYASDDDEREESLHEDQNPNTMTLPPPKSNPIGPKSLFSSLPTPKSVPKTPSVDPIPPKSNHGDRSYPQTSLFSSIPAPKSIQPAFPNQNPRKVVQFTLPIVTAWLKLKDLEEDDEEEGKERKPVKDSSSNSSKGLISMLPAPKNSLCLAPIPSAASRRSVLEADDASAMNHEDLGPPAKEASGFHSCGDEVGVTSEYTSSGHEASSWVSSYGSGEEYGGYGGSWSDGNVDGLGSYSGSWYDGSVAMPTASPEIPVVEIPVVERIGGKRGRNDIPAEIVEVKQDELMKNRPREDQAKMTGIAFGPSCQPVSSSKGKPSKLHKRKHQIGSLFYDMKQKEMELAERRSRGLLTKAETQAKYGW